MDLISVPKMSAEHMRSHW
uniref:Hexosyltransferase n=1 Tax=Rhizophora mucronata TaxID=61149 RepID=A0A2P2KKB8_RHIMU